MSILSEIDRIKTNIAGSYLSASTKGAIIPENQNSDNLPSTIDTIPEAETSIVTATNYTGNNITAGDKVWLTPKTNISSSAIAVYNSSAIPALTPGGEYVYYSTKRYNVNDNTTINSSIEMISNLDSQACILRYGINNSLHYGPYRLYPTEMSDNKMYVQGYYMTSRTTSTSFSSIYLYKIDSEYNILHTWTVTGYNQYAYYILTVIGNKLYMGSENTNAFIGTIDENSDTIVLSSTNVGQVLYSTRDNKIAIVGNYKHSGSGYNNIRFYYINNDYTITNNFMTANEDLINICSNTELLISFNQNNNVLCLSKNNVYGVFKYNEELEDFETISLVLDDTSGAPTVGWYLMTMNTDMSKLQYGNKLYTLEQINDYTYKAIPYSAITQDSFTGIANSNAIPGQQFNATTALEIGSTSENLLYNESNELNAILRSEENQPQESNIETLVESIERLEEILGE